MTIHIHTTDHALTIHRNVSQVRTYNGEMSISFKYDPQTLETPAPIKIQLSEVINWLID